MSELLAAHQALLNWAGKTPNRIFLNQPVDGELRKFTWQQCADSCRRIASALQGLGLQEGYRVAILSKNCAEWFLADMAIAMAGLVSVPIYPTANEETIGHVMKHSEAKAIFVGKLDRPGTAEAAIGPSVITISFPYQTMTCGYRWHDLIDSNEPLAELYSPQADDEMTILYTSGSTGQPKGVVLSYGAYAYASQTTLAVNSGTPEDRLFSYLPLAHITERTCTAGPAVYGGCECYFVESLDTFPDDLRRAQPTVFISVPRLWVKFQSAVHAKISPMKLRFLLALPLIGPTIARRIRREFGFGNCRSFCSGSAPISPLTLKWWKRLGVGIGEGWGMSETGGLSCGNFPYTAERIGTIGKPLDGTEMKLSDEGEILLRSPGLFAGYYKQPELTRESFTEDGFFRTGDRAQWVESLRAYRITGRVKDVFKSAKGKYVTPVPIESRLSGNALLEQICVMGSGLPAPVAVVVLTKAAQYLSRDDVRTSLQTTLEAVNARAESHERISNVLIASDEWTIENELLTPTLKLKRDKLEAKYGDLIGQEFSNTIAWEHSTIQ